MIVNETFYCFAKKTKCYIENNIIKPFPSSITNLMLIYNPFEESKMLNVPLYSIFSNIKTNNDIIKFIENYGFLGLGYHPLNNKNWFEFTTSIVKNTNFYNGYSESVDEFVNEVSLMNSLLELIEAFKNNTLSQNEISKKIDSKVRINKVEEFDLHPDYLELQEKIDNVYKYNGRSIDTDFENTTKHPRLVAPDLIIREIEIKLRHVNLRLSYDTIEQRFAESRIVHNLLTSLYLMIYEDLTAGKRFIRCANKTCNNWFAIDTNHNKKYCNPNCEKAEKQRRYRQNLKNKKEV